MRGPCRVSSRLPSPGTTGHSLPCCPNSELNSDTPGPSGDHHLSLWRQDSVPASSAGLGGRQASHLPGYPESAKGLCVTLGPREVRRGREEVRVRVRVRDGSRLGRGCREDDPLELLILPPGLHVREAPEQEKTPDTLCPPPRPPHPQRHHSWRQRSGAGGRDVDLVSIGLADAN